MQCKDLELVFETEGLGTLSAEAREHLAECANCQGLLADLHSIVAVASTLPSEIEPPARVWTSLRAQLEAEGLIKEPIEAPQVAPWWESLRAAFQIRSLAAAALGVLLIAGAILFTHRTPTDQRFAGRPAEAQNPQQQAKVPAPVPPASLTPVPRAVVDNPHATTHPPSRTRQLAPSPTETASTTLAQAETTLPDMQLAGSNARVDASFRQNLRTLNQFIAECERHLRQNPRDELAREYLNMAYQQKADLLAAMMENGRSEH